MLDDSESNPGITHASIWLHLYRKSHGNVLNVHMWFRFSSSGSVSAAAVLQRHRRLPGVRDVHLHHVWLPRPSGDLVLVGNSNVCQETLWMFLLGPKDERQTLKMQWCVVQYVGRWTSLLVYRAQCPRFIYSICMQMAAALWRRAVKSRCVLWSDFQSLPW